MIPRMKRGRIGTLLCGSLMIIASLLLIAGCSKDSTNSEPGKTVPHEGRWGIYELNPASQDVRLIYSTDDEMNTSALRLNSAGDKFVFAQKIGDTTDQNYEICTVDTGGGNFMRLTDNAYFDVYPAWSPDDNSIAFLSWRDADFDLYVMDANGANAHLLYNSGSHDADIDWAADIIVFTSGSKIWKIDSGGANPTQLTDPSRAGEWGDANLPFGDYDPRLSDDGAKIVFERMEDDTSPYGNYNLFVIDSTGAGETRLTDNGYSQGLPEWSHSGDKVVYIVSAIGSAGAYDLYMINADGSNNHSITPGYFPATFLCHAATFSPDDTHIYFIGEWYQ
jgi:Tol biopolymer transport system component